MSQLLGCCSDRKFALGVGGHGFDPRPNHTKDFKRGSNGFRSMALRIIGLLIQLTRCCRDKWTSITVNLPIKRRDKTGEKPVESGVKHNSNTKQTHKHCYTYLLFERLLVLLLGMTQLYILHSAFNLYGWFHV